MSQIRRKDKCHLVGKRADLLTVDQKANAWAYLAGQLAAFGSVDNYRNPRFNDLLQSIRAATIYAKSKSRIGTQSKA